MFAIMQTLNLYLSKAKQFFSLPFWSSWRTITVVYAFIPIIIGIPHHHRHPQVA